jgi:diadenosine tetraphosphate (Ap4A) HIT family hydrolase
MAYDRENIFARILRKEIPCTPVYEDEFALAFPDISPAAPTHVLVIPKGEFCSFDDFMLNAQPAMVQGFFAAVQRLAAQLGVDQTGYRIISNHGAHASQTVPHFHIHLLGGRALGGLLPGDPLHR